MADRGVFESLRDWLTHKGYSYRQLFWITGFLAFFISPVADNLTTLMVWQKGMIEFQEFFKIFLPALVNYLIPAFIMSFSISIKTPHKQSESTNPIKLGGIIIVILFVTTIITAVSFHSFLNLPPVFGMMFGLGYLKIYSYFLNKKLHRNHFKSSILKNNDTEDYDIFDKIAKAEWDTLFFLWCYIKCRWIGVFRLSCPCFRIFLW